MTCQEVDERLDDWVDGSSTRRRRRRWKRTSPRATSARRGSAGCGSCWRTPLPSPVAHPAPGPVARHRAAHRARADLVLAATSWQPWALAAAATVLVGLVAVLWSGRAPSAVRTVEIPAATPEARLAALPTVSDPALAAAERDYEAAANALLEALQKRQAEIQPETLVAVRANLEVIDRALAEVREALVRDPSNPELNRMLVATHRKKVDVLRRVVRLSTAL